MSKHLKKQKRRQQRHLDRTNSKTFGFETGMQVYVVNDYCLTFNPADSEFISDFNSMLRRISGKQDELATVMREAGDDSEAVVDALKEYCEVGTRAFDECFGDGASDGVFQGCSPFAIQPGTRLPLWVIFCDYISSVVMDALDELPDETNTDSLRVDGAKSRALMQKYKIKYR